MQKLSSESGSLAENREEKKLCLKYVVKMYNGLKWLTTYQTAGSYLSGDEMVAERDLNFGGWVVQWKIGGRWGRTQHGKPTLRVD